MSLILEVLLKCRSWYSRRIIEKCKFVFKSRSKENHDKIKRYLGRGKDKSEEEEENKEEKDEDEEIVPDVVESNKSELVCILEKERKFKVQNKLVKI